VEKKTDPRLKAGLPLAFCADPVDDPAIGMAQRSGTEQIVVEEMGYRKARLIQSLPISAKRMAGDKFSLASFIQEIYEVAACEISSKVCAVL